MKFIAVEHRSAESKGLRFESSWGLTIVSLSQARGKTKNIFLYFTELKTYYIPHSIYFRIIWTFESCLYSRINNCNILNNILNNCLYSRIKGASGETSLKFCWVEEP